MEDPMLCEKKTRGKGRNGNTKKNNIRDGSSGILRHLRRSLVSLKAMTWSQIAGMTLCLLVVIIAGSGQLILVNLWVHSFPTATTFAQTNHTSLVAVAGHRYGSGDSGGSGDPSTTTNYVGSYDLPYVTNAPPAVAINVSFTVMTFIVVPNAIFFTITFALWYLVKRPSCKFMLGGRAQLLAFGVGFGNSIFNIVFTSALKHTPEVVQAFLLSSTILWTFLFVKLFFKEKRSYNSPLIWISFIFSLGGIIVGSANHLQGDETGGLTASAWGWTGLFAFIQIPVSLAAVTQTMFMRRFTVASTGVEKKAAVEKKAGGGDEGSSSIQEGFDSPTLLSRSETFDSLAIANTAVTPVDVVVGGGGSADTLTRLEVGSIVGDGDDDTVLVGTDADTAKFASLWLSALWEVPILAMMLPLGALPWFGDSPNVSALYETIEEGFKCTFGLVPHTPNTYEPWVYGTMYNIFYGIKNVGGTFLAYYSPATASLVSQLSSPLTALALLAMPRLNVHGGSSNVSVPMTIGAVVLLMVSSVLYTAWEESTRDEDGVNAHEDEDGDDGETEEQSSTEMRTLKPFTIGEEDEE